MSFARSFSSFLARLRERLYDEDDADAEDIFGSESSISGAWFWWRLLSLRSDLLPVDLLWPCEFYVTNTRR